MRADVILGGVIALLFGGIYLVLFVLPQIQESDLRLVGEIQRANFKQQFDRRLQLIGEGRYWLKIPEQLLEDEEQPVTEAFSADTFQTIPVLVARDGGETWTSTAWDQLGGSFVDRVSVGPGGRDFLAAGADGGNYLLKTYPDMATWDDRSLAEIRRRMSPADKCLRNRAIGREITEFLNSATSADVHVGDSRDSKSGNGEGSISRFVDDLTVMRVVALTVLFFLVQILVRLYQYSLRLAAFGGSRADAVLLAQSFAYHSAEAFDDLVRALAPDGYDFKPPPRSGHEALLEPLLSRRQKS